jgi:hypothetical protein
VLIIGGDENANTAELYDPATGTFTALGNMVTSRYYPAVVQMPNGKVLIAGGLEGWSAGPGSAPPSPGWTGNDPGQSAEIYDPATRTFAATSDEDGFVQAPQTGTLLGDGTVLVAGGNAGAFGAETHIYNPATATFAAAPSLNNGRLQDTATYLNNGQVLFIGGQDCLVEFCGNAWPGTYSLARPLDIPGVLVLSGAELYTPGGGGTGTTVTFSSSPTRSTYGQNVTLTATVVPDTSACTPSPGNMVFLDPLWNQLAVVPVDSGGTASTSLNTLPFGSWPLRVDYAGNTTCGESLAALVQTVAPLLTVTVSGGPFSYDGNPHPATCAVTWGGSQVAGSCALTYAPGGANVPVTAGTYSVTAVFTPTDTTDFTSATGIGSITILPAFQTITCQPQTWGTAPVSPCSGASGATITYTATWGPVSLSTRAPSPTVKLSTNMQLPATANVLAVATAIPNYALTTVDVAFTVGKLTATIGCSYKLQDGTTGPDLPASATYGDPPITFTCQSNVPSTIAAPQYAVTPSGTSWAANKLTLKAAGTYNMTVKLNNGNPGNIYTAVTWPSGTQNGSIQVAQAPLSVLAGSANWTYASKSDSKLTAKLDPNSHMVNGDRAPVMSVFVSTDTAGADKVSLSPSPLAGTYYTHVNTLNLKNYAVKYEYGTLTVNPATTALTVSPAAVTMTVTAGKSGQATVTVLNETGETLDIAPSSLAAPFGVGQGCTNVAGNGGKCQVTVTFSPIVKGTKQTTLKFTASESTTDQFSGDTFTMHSVTIKGTGR